MCSALAIPAAGISIRCVLYCRVSTDEQTRPGYDSLQTQADIHPPHPLPETPEGIVPHKGEKLTATHRLWVR